MKRGRPSVRRLVIDEILNILINTNTPVTTTTITKQLSTKLSTNISWNTVQKYLSELVEVNKVQVVSLPHSKKAGKEGLSVYMVKR